MKRKLYAPNYLPTQNYILVLPDPSIDKVGSIILPDSQQQKQNRGTVITLGDQLGDDMQIPENIGVGTRVGYSQYAGTELELATPFSEKMFDKEKYLVLRASDVIGIFPVRDADKDEIFTYEKALQEGYVEKGDHVVTERPKFT